jgi:hypothetical protein
MELHNAARLRLRFAIAHHRASRLQRFRQNGGTHRQGIAFSYVRPQSAGTGAITSKEALMRNTLLATVAAVALAAGTVAVSAQGMSPGASPPAAAPTNPSTTAPPEKMDKSSPGAQKGAPAGERSTTGQGRPEGGQGQMDRGGQAQQPRTGQEGQQPRQEMQREGQQPRQDMQREGQTPRAGQGQNQQQTGQGGATSGSVSFTTEQKTKIRQTVLQSSNAPRVTNVNFDIKVGTAVPRERVKLVEVPPPLIEIHPQWRGFLYFVVNDEIIIVDPKTYRIVAVIEV